MKNVLLAASVVLVGLVLCLALTPGTVLVVAPEAHAQTDAPALTGKKYDCKVKFDVGACQGSAEFPLCSPNSILAQVAAKSGVCRSAGSCEDVCWDHGDVSCSETGESCHIPD